MDEIDTRFRDLIDRVREGSEEAAQELVQEYGDSVRRAVRRALSRKLRSKFDSVDFVQIVWSSLFKVRGRLNRFDRPEDLAAFLVAMARNKVGMEARRRLAGKKYDVTRETVRNQSAGQSSDTIDASSPEPIDLLIAREQWDRLVRDQPDHYRQIIRLRVQGYSQQDIAKTLHLDESTVRRFLSKLRHRIRA